MKLLLELILAIFLLCYVLPKVEPYLKDKVDIEDIKDKFFIKKLGKLGKCKKANRLTDTARQCIGIPYEFGGTSFKTGIDCSYFIQYVCARNGIQLPRTAREQYCYGVRVPKDKLVPGDLVFFTTYWFGPSHVGMYVGDNKFIHASSGKGKVIISKMSGYYNKKYIGAKRLV